MNDDQFIGRLKAVTMVVPDEFLIYNTENFSYVVPKDAYDRILEIPEGSVRRQSEAFNYAVLVVRKADRAVTKSRWF